MNVLIASDGSASSLNATATFCRLSAPVPHNLTIMTVDEVTPFGFLDEEMRRQVTAMQSAQANECFLAADAVLKSNQRSGQHVERQGHAANEIVSWSDAHAIDLAVVGSNGGGIVSRLLLGSTSDAVVSHIHTSVLVVPPAKSPVPQPNECHVVIAWDGSDQSKAALRFLTTWRLVPTSRLTVVSFLPRPRDLPEEIEYDHKQIEQQSQAMESELKELRECYSEVKVHVAESLHPASAIVEYAQSHKSSMIVVGDKGRTAVQRILIGSVARHILHHAPCAVLVVKGSKS
jgi:nucleotide-binding universal stress UspA family protein